MPGAAVPGTEAPLDALAGDIRSRTASDLLRSWRIHSCRPGIVSQSAPRLAMQRSRARSICACCTAWRFAAQEQKVLIDVTNARAKVGSIQATPELVNDPAAFQKFTQAQGELTGALSRLLVVAEAYPQLKSDANFRDLQAQLEGTENRITTARNRFIKAVQDTTSSRVSSRPTSRQ